MFDDIIYPACDKRHRDHKITRNMFASGHNRRQLLLIIAAVMSCVLLSRASIVDAASSPQLRIAVVHFAAPRPDSSQRQLLNGITLGLEEATQTAAMFGFEVRADTLDIDELKVRLRTSPSGTEFTAVLGGTTLDECRQLASAAQSAGVLYLNAGCSADALRAESCDASFHVAPSDGMLASALDAVAKRDSTGARVRPSLPVTSWHASLERFGAGQLSDRYRARFKHDTMSALAWNGWFAVKVLTEAFLRSKSADVRTLATYLVSERARFDGHKGVPLSFRAWDHQLRQPLYVVRSVTGDSSAPAVDEIPDLRRAEGAVNDVLDQLGSTASSHICR